MASCFLLLAVYWSFGPSCSVASPEWFSNISTSLFKLPGDIMLGGLFPLNQLTSNLSQIKEPGDIICDSLNDRGFGLSLAMKFAVDEINANQLLLPGIKLGYDVYDTCMQSAVIVRPTMSFLTEKANKTLFVECNYTDYETSISAVIGPYSSEMVSVIGKLLGFFLMPQISYGATSDKFSNNLLYPSFFRTVPSDKWQVDVMVLLMKKFNWNWVAVVGSEEEYGQRGVQDFSKLAENTSVCVAYQGLIPVYTDPASAIKTIIDNINATSVNVVVVFSLADPAEAFFKEVIRRQVKCVWIASTSWAIHYKITSLPNIHTVGTIIGFLDKIDTLEMLSGYTRELFKKLSEERASSQFTDPDHPNNRCPECLNLSPANITIVKDPAVTRTAFSVYAAVYSVAQALHNLLGCNSTACQWRPETKIYPWKLLEVLRNTSVTLNGTTITFDKDGNPNIGYDVIEWEWNPSRVDFTTVGYYDQKLHINVSKMKWHTKNSEVPDSTCSAECKPGQVRRVKGFHSCCFDCIDCLPGYYQANDDDIQCTKCPEGQWSAKLSTSCKDPTFEYFSLELPRCCDNDIGWVGVLVCQAVAVVFVMHRGTPLITASGGVLSFVALLGLMGACLSLLLFLGKPQDGPCRLQLPLTTIFQTLALSIILSISLQIFYVTEFPETAASHLHILRGPGSWLFVLVCCAVEAGLCGWFAQEEQTLSEYLEKIQIEFLTSFLSCPATFLTGFALMQGFNGAMALVSFMCTFMAVKPLHQYNLARDITFSTLIYCVIWVVFIPIYIGNNSENNENSRSRSIVHVYFSLASNLGLVAAYYFPKCYLLLRKPDLNIPKYFCTFLEGVPPTQTQEEQEPKPTPQSETEQ
ncbi:LOW QUALITY PROTEIN: taste receptor type 1 member 3 [Pholidichthys leucotaenia]